MDVDQPIWPMHHVPAPDLPKWFAKELTRFGGTNQYGDPNWRIVWGMNARGFVNDNPRAIKYMNPRQPDIGWACWMLEQYATPEFFNEFIWNKERYGRCELGTGKIIDRIGPFPRRGDYILIAPLMTDDDGPGTIEMIPATRALLDGIMERITIAQQTDDVLGLVELRRRKRMAQKDETIHRMIKERREYYETNAAKINAAHARDYVGLKAATPRLLPASTESTAAFQSLGLGTTAKENPCRP